MTKAVTVFGIFFVALLLAWVAQYQVSEYFEQDDPMLHHLKRVLLPVHPTVKDLKLYKSNKAYTINKDKIYLCLYDKDGEYYPLSTLSYVLLHELAHKINKEDVGHTQKFFEIFDELLLKATELGIYNPDISVDKSYSNHN